MAVQPSSRNAVQYDLDCLIVGAGVVGLAIAAKLAAQGFETIVVERQAAAGQGISSRNSEVIHAGIYYPHGSFKARLCVEGRTRLYDYCISHHVPHKRCGKLIVATHDSQRHQLEAIKARAAGNGVALELWEKSDIQALEPETSAVLALHSPQTGIVDTHALMLALQGEAESHGCAFAFNTPLLSARPLPEGGFAVQLSGADPCEITVRQFCLASGLNAPMLARAIAGIRQEVLPKPWFAKGSYFSLARRAPFSRLIYPMPEPGGLGVHLTLDLAGRARFGPDVEWLEVADEAAIDYAVNPARAEKFYAAIRTYWPALRDGELLPDYSGVRPKIAGPGAPDADFTILGPQEHSLNGLTCLFGIESPGLTSALAIADHVAQMIAENAQP